MGDQLLTDISGPLPRKLADQGDGTVAEVVVVAGGAGGGGEGGGLTDTQLRATPVPVGDVALVALQKAEDAAAASGWSGLGVLAVRRDAEASTVGADGDFAEVQVDSAGRVKVNGKITDATIAVPSDIQSVFRTQSFLSTAVLGAAGVFTGAGVDALNFRRITGRVVASHAGVLHIEHSDDNATWDSVDPLTVAAGVAYGYDVPVFARYIRLLYVNGATAQTSFRLSGYLSAA